jgi:hypothetical protein
VTVKLPVAVLAVAPNTTAWLEPAETLKGVEGFELTPFGSPVRVTCTAPLNPFWAVTDKVTGELVAPWVTLTEFEEMATEKSGWGGGGG